MKTSRFAMMSIIALVITVSACETPNNPSNTDAPNPPGTGWVQFDTTRYKGSLANFTILQNVISFDINAVHPDGCVPQTTFTQARNGNIFAVKIFFKPQDPTLGCTGALTPFTVRVSLPASTGTYRVRLDPTTLSRVLDTTITIP